MAKSFAPDFSKTCFLYRFEVYIPIIDNEGKPIEILYLKELNETLVDTFGGVSLNYPYGGSGGVDGMYYSNMSKMVFRDKSAVIMVLAKDDEESFSFFVENQTRWEKKFKQEKILIMMYKVQSI